MAILRWFQPENLDLGRFREAPVMAILSKPCRGMDPNAGHGVASLRPEIYRKVHGNPFACERLSA